MRIYAKSNLLVPYDKKSNILDIVTIRKKCKYSITGFTNFIKPVSLAENMTSKEPSILVIYGSISTSCKWICVWAWYSRKVESKRIESHTPSPIHCICLTWLSRRGWTAIAFWRKVHDILSQNNYNPLAFHTDLNDHVFLIKWNKANKTILLSSPDYQKLILSPKKKNKKKKTLRTTVSDSKYRNKNNLVLAKCYKFPHVNIKDGLKSKIGIS